MARVQTYSVTFLEKKNSHNDYVSVISDDFDEAHRKFRQEYPNAEIVEISKNSMAID